MSIARRKISVLLLLVLNTNVVTGRMRGQWSGWGGYTSSTNVDEVDEEPSAEEDEDYECLPECALSATHDQYKGCVMKIAIGTGDRKAMVKMIEDAKKSDCCKDGPEGGGVTTMTSSAEDDEETKPDATTTKTKIPPGKSEAVKKAMQRWKDRQKDKDQSDEAKDNKPHNSMEALQQIKDAYAAGKAEEEEEEAMQTNNDEEKPIEYSDVPVCKDGQAPLTDPKCGRGFGPCGDGKYCNVHPTDRWAVCCRNEIPELDDSLPDKPESWDVVFMERAADCRDAAEKQQEHCMMLYDAMKNMDDTNPRQESVRKNLWDALGVLSKYGECEKKNKMKAILDVKAEEMLEEEKKDDNGSSAEDEKDEPPMQVYPIVPEPKEPPMQTYPTAPEEPPEPEEQRVCRPTIDKTNSMYDRFEGTGFNNDCTTDKDCFTEGCSGEVCSAEQGISTTCDVVEDFEGNCLCVAGKCLWAFCAAMP